EALKILSGVGQVASKRLTIFDALAGRFTTVRLRGRNPACVACGSSPSITAASLPSYDYTAFTGQPADDGPPPELRLIDPRVRLQPADVARLLAASDDKKEETEKEKNIKKGKEDESECMGRETEEIRQKEEASSTSTSAPACRPLFLDVRPQAQYDVMALPGVVHVPYERLDERLPEILALCGGGSGSSSEGIAGASGAADVTAATTAANTTATTCTACDAAVPPHAEESMSPRNPTSTTSLPASAAGDGEV
ncbi:hypothetical protein Agub_g885, partial [Astrephomene gubernaculifera]